MQTSATFFVNWNELTASARAHRINTCTLVVSRDQSAYTQCMHLMRCLRQNTYTLDTQRHTFARKRQITKTHSYTLKAYATEYTSMGIPILTHKLLSALLPTCICTGICNTTLAYLCAQGYVCACVHRKHS